MRVILVGTPADRDRLRAQMNGSMTVVAEFPTMAAAERSDLDADALVVAADSAHGETLESDDSFDEPLTPREIQVLELLAEGLPNKTIAVRLGISDQTVKFHVASISGKLGAANRTDAVRRAVRRGLITL
jgi:DNA-binding NarL/FixJ family response regulator